MRSPLRALERVLLVAGATMMSAALAVTLYGYAASQLTMWAFDSAQSAVDGDEASAVTPDDVQFSLWNPKRILAYESSLLGRSTPPLAVLRIEKLALRVPVFEGTSDLVLNRGAGWIEGTAKPGERGNAGIAGHRDGFFRSLKDVAVGDRIEVAMDGRMIAFAVDEIAIVEPDDVHVLQPRPRPSVTLVTCYPFYFVGSAPQRFIVHASVLEDEGSGNGIKLRPAAIGVRSEEERQ
jgi:sortase A